MLKTARRGLSWHRRIGVVVIVALGALGLTACHPNGAHITATPALYPAFQGGVTNYVNRCDPNTPTGVHVTAPSGVSVSVNGAPAQTGDFTVQVAQDVGQSFTIAVTNDDATTSNYVRCLPTDFPAWSAEQSGPPQAAYYATVLIEGGAADYAAVFDNNGVPVWWLKDRLPTFLLTPLQNKNFAIVRPGFGLEEYDLSGNRLRRVMTVGITDFHDVILLPNGNYAMATVEPQSCDLTTWGLTASETCYNHVFQELTPTGSLVWSWDTAAHIPVTETPEHWRENHQTVPPDAYDPWHYNSVKYIGGDFVISFRHLDAVYRINQATGDIVWKLGGTPHPKSLELIGDALGGPRGQHDARPQFDGSVTIYDNGTCAPANGSECGPGRQPRGVRYAVDRDEMTATLLEDVRDSGITGSFCCGSSRRLAGGNWVNGWGGGSEITENRPDGTRVFRLSVGFVYRGSPIPPGVFTPTEFRNGMDAQYP